MLAMAIRFQCGSCSQPIEVDDELASKVVGCPYCRNTVTTPAESTLEEPDRIPVASPLDASGGTFQAASTPPTGYIGAQAKSNPLAVAAFVLACAMVALQIGSGMILSAHDLEWEQLQEEMTSSGADFSSQFDAMNRFAKEHGGTFPTWVVVLGLMQLGSLAICLAAVVCGILALRRTARRALTIASLAICALFLALSCLGFMVS